MKITKALIDRIDFDKQAVLGSTDDEVVVAGEKITGKVAEKNVKLIEEYAASSEGQTVEEFVEGLKDEEELEFASDLQNVEPQQLAALFAQIAEQRNGLKVTSVAFDSIGLTRKANDESNTLFTKAMVAFKDVSTITIKDDLSSLSIDVLNEGLVLQTANTAINFTGKLPLQKPADVKTVGDIILKQGFNFTIDNPTAYENSLTVYCAFRDEINTKLSKLDITSDDTSVQQAFHQEITRLMLKNMNKALAIAEAVEKVVDAKPDDKERALVDAYRDTSNTSNTRLLAAVKQEGKAKNTLSLFGKFAAKSVGVFQTDSEKAIESAVVEYENTHQMSFR